jgi:hypothetical protein
MSAKKKGLGIDIDEIAGKAKTLNQKGTKKTKADYVATAIHIPKEMLNMLRLVAAYRANREGGRASVSNVIVQIIEGHRQELEAEIKRQQ